MKRTSVLLILATLGGLTAGCGSSPPPPVPPRPVKTLVVEGVVQPWTLTLPGKLLAGERVQLSFTEAGSLIELNVQEGQQVEAGHVMARLDPRDFENARSAAIAERERAKAQYERVKAAADLHAVSQQELTNVRAVLDVAEAQVKIRQKSVEDSVVTAPFSGLIAKRFVDNFTTVQPRQPIVALQSLTNVEIEAFVPEAVLIGSDPTQLGQRHPNLNLTVSFDALPGVTFPVTPKEFSTDADPATQAFRVVVTMPAPADYWVLPGMTATLNISEKTSEGQKKVLFLPLSAVPVDEATGKFSVWVVNRMGEGAAIVSRRYVELGEASGDRVLVRTGLVPGDRVVLTGANALHEGQVVRLVD